MSLRAATRVIKVGGSLFELADLGHRIQRWLSVQPPAANVFLAGGGDLADEVRRWDDRFGLDEESAHWLCVDLLKTTSYLLHLLLPESLLIDDFDALTRATADKIVVFQPTGWLRRMEPHCDSPLPHDWSVTTDSIAVQVANLLQVNELVLLKSSPAPAPCTREFAAESGFVDAYFVTASAFSSVSRVRVVNLRDDDFAEQDLQ